MTDQETQVNEVLQCLRFKGHYPYYKRDNLEVYFTDMNEGYFQLNSMVNKSGAFRLEFDVVGDTLQFLNKLKQLGYT